MPKEVPDDAVADYPARSHLRVGCADLPSGLRRERYFEKVNYLECEGTLHGLPKTSVLERWRSDAGEDGRYGLFAPQVISHPPGPKGYARGPGLAAGEVTQAGSFRATGVVRRAVAALAQVVANLQADAVIFRSPPEFAPSAANRDTLRAFFGEVATAEALAPATRVWEPQGLWEPRVAAKLAAELGVVYACDPVSNDPLAEGPEFFANLPGNAAYFRITGLGQSRRRFDEYAAESLIELVEGYEQVWVVFAHMHKYPDATRFLKVFQDMSSAEPE